MTTSPPRDARPTPATLSLFFLLPLLPFSLSLPFFSFSSSVFFFPDEPRLVYTPSGVAPLVAPFFSFVARRVGALSLPAARLSSSPSTICSLPVVLRFWLLPGYAFARLTSTRRLATPSSSRPSSAAHTSPRLSGPSPSPPIHASRSARAAPCCRYPAAAIRRLTSSPLWVVGVRPAWSRRPSHLGDDPFHLTILLPLSLSCLAVERPFMGRKLLVAV
ncbi:hypothetical protein NL676_023854 [Syzygium grande]|nr:hypothetical protein NL676_023854 [Syzygium grande]